jgi:hypothetical protein
MMERSENKSSPLRRAKESGPLTILSGVERA